MFWGRRSWRAESAGGLSPADSQLGLEAISASWLVAAAVSLIRVNKVLGMLI